MKQVQFTDAVALREVKTHKDGYKIVRGRIARTGLQGYLRRELGDAAPMGDPNDVLQIYRPDDEVFADEALNGWAHVPVTVDHPPELVTPDNVSKYAVGETTVRAHADRETGWLDLEWIVKDAKGIAALDSTHKEVSGGYQALIDFKPGVTPNGEKYDGVQRGINPNHLALVPKGRAFSDAAPVAKWGATPVILDKKEVQMDIKTVVVGDKAVQVAASDAHTIEQVMKDHKAELSAKDAELAAAQETIGELKAECADTAKKVMSDADIAAAVVARKAVTDKAAEFVEGFKDEGQTLADIKRAAVKAKFGDEAAATDVSDAEINGIFRVMEPAKVNDAAREAMKKGRSEKSEEDMGDAWGKTLKKMKGEK